jgi:putative phosphoesterase
MPQPRTRFLPPGVADDQVAACLGLVSDTHMPQRLDALPPALFAALRGVDLLLHAGDVGDLSVLDALSALAPVIAVAGNDGSPDADRELPLQQVIVVGGQRVLLHHSHDRDPAREAEQRRGDAWAPKLARWAEAGRRAGARVVAFGHTHVPMAVEHEGVLLVNPGALASPNMVTRPARRTVALLWIMCDGAPAVSHVDLAAPDAPYVPDIDWDAGFSAAHAAAVASLLSPALAADYTRVHTEVFPLAPGPARAARDRVARRCWRGELDAITHDAIVEELRADPGLPAELRARLEDALLRGTPV